MIECGFYIFFIDRISDCLFCVRDRYFEYDSYVDNEIFLIIAIFQYLRIRKRQELCMRKVVFFMNFNLLKINFKRR